MDDPFARHVHMSDWGKALKPPISAALRRPLYESAGVARFSIERVFSRHQECPRHCEKSGAFGQKPQESKPFI